MRIPVFSVILGVACIISQRNVISKFDNQVNLLKSGDNTEFQTRHIHSASLYYSYTEDLLALILKEDVKPANCQAKLKEYCDNIKKITSIISDINPILDEICKNQNKCTDLETNVADRCKALNQTLSTKPLTLERCISLHQQCLFLEGTCPETLKNNCNSVGNTRYRRKRQNLKNEIFLRAVPGNFENIGTDACQKALKKVCPKLALLGRDLISQCFDLNNTCEPLVLQQRTTAIFLKMKPRNVQTDCNKLKTQCQENGVEYRPPGNAWFPIDSEPIVAKEVNLKALYQQAERDGVLIEQKLTLSMEDLLLFLGQSYQKGGFDPNQCKTEVQTHGCNYLKTLTRDDDYDCNDINTKCQKLKTTFQTKFNRFSDEIKQKTLFSGYKNGNAKILGWYELPSIPRETCDTLEFSCFFLNKYDKDSNLKITCQNVRVICYKSRLDNLAYEMLESQMRGIFRDSGNGNDWSNTCQKKLVEVCKGIKHQNFDFFSLCVQPETTCPMLQRDLQEKTNKLKDILNKKQDSPNKEDCISLEAKCDALKHDDPQLTGSCYTLKSNCLRLNESEELGFVLLKEKKNISGADKCTSKLNEKCDSWSRKIDKQFSVSCALQNGTCNFITSDVQSYCKNFRKNINKSNIVDELEKVANNTDELSKLYPRWAPYCEMLLQSCPELTGNGANKLCKEIQTLCEPYQTREALETALIYKFQGNFKDITQCDKTLTVYCTQNRKLKREALRSFCNDNPKNKNDTLVTKKLCESLPNLEKRITNYNKLKKNAEDAANKTNIILTFILNTTMDQIHNSHAIVRRSSSHLPLTGMEASTFDLLGERGVQILKKRDQAVGDGIGEEHLLALILKEEGLEEEQCKQKLGEYCGELHNANLTSKDIHDKLKDYCNKDQANEDKCKTLKTNVEAKCDKLKEALEEALKTLNETVCKEYEHECLFLEGADPNNLKEPCSNLRTKCYELKRRRVRDNVLMRALSGNLKEKPECEKALKKHCVTLASMSPDLMQACLNVDNGTCEHLVGAIAPGKCTSLKTEVDKALKNPDKTKCLPLLEKCHFYGPNCNDKEKPKCDELTTECEKHDVEYMPPEGPFIPIDPTVTVLDQVGLDALYKEAAKEGVLIERLSDRSLDNLLLFLGQKDSGDFDEQQCKKEVKGDKCDYLKTLTGEKDDKYDCEAKCGQLKVQLTTNRNSLKDSIKKNYFFGKNNRDKADNTLLGWHVLQPTIITEDCARFESQCFYLDRHGKSTELEKACQNVRAMCYKRGLNDVAHEALQSQMRGYFDYSGNDWLNKCQKNLTKVCKELKDKNHDLLALCLQPKDTCDLLIDDIQNKARYLTYHLDQRRDSPYKEDCIKLEAKCDALEQDAFFLSGPCDTLRKNCRHLNESREVGFVLLNEKKNISEFGDCESEVNEGCNRWLRKAYRSFELACALPTDTCNTVTLNVKNYCKNLLENINKSGIVGQLEKDKDNMDQLRKLCPPWVTYCNMLLPSCPGSTDDDDTNKLCKKIQEKCGPYQKQQAAEDAVMYKFQGHLGHLDNCTSKFTAYCAQGQNSTNNTLNGLCTNTSTSGAKKGEKTVREKLCERLVTRVRKWCRTLPDELKEAKKDLEKRVEAYQELKSKADEAANKTNIILTFYNTTANQSHRSHSIMKRSYIPPLLTPTAANALDLMALLVDTYVDLDNMCKKLLLDCGFEKDCKGN
ncbi:hypothetical protein PCK1_000256 [Pneumocystis canis]|nr:hypothetical protein PCK1_000256 [Pneumocystis canis]